MAKEDDAPLEEMRCRSCGMLLGYKKRQGPFIFWCSEACSESVNSKMEHDQIRDEVAVELYLGGIGMMEIARFTDTPFYTRVQQILYRRGIDLSAERTEAATYVA